MRFAALLATLALLTSFTAAPLVRAEEPATDKAQQAAIEMQAAITEANAAIKRGPENIPLSSQAALNLPEGYGFIPAAPSLRVLRAMGNRPGEDVLGMIVPTQSDDSWFMVVRFDAAGYVKDEDARDWNADDMLNSLREGTEEANAGRRERGMPEMEVLGWVEKPQYDAASHRLVWSLSSRDKGSTGDDQGVNYNTLMLGREGFVSMNMVAGLKEIEALKPTARLLLSALEFNAGKRYADFNSSTDKVAEYGLAALVAGVAAKKLGLLAVIAAFAAKFAKVIGIAVIAGGAGLSKFFGRKKAADNNEQA